jgi:ParB-like chromosome segregation protein Spo0J
MGRENETGPTWPADHVQRRPVSKLIPYARNARTHSEAQVAQLAASIREYGFTMPVLLDEDGTIIAGHGRVMAARLLGIKEVPTMTAKGWPEAKRRAYVLADNKLAMNSAWDLKLLASELTDLQAMGADLNVIGFSDEDMRRINDDLDLERLRGNAAPPPTESGPANSSRATGDLVQFSVMMTPEQRHTASQAVKQAMKFYGADNSADGLMAIIHEWEGGHRGQ